MFIKLMKAVYFKPTVLLMAIAMLTMSFTMPGEVVTLKAGTTIPLELVSTLSSEGELTVTIRSVKAVDGTMVYLSGSSLSDEGGNKLALSIVLTICCLFGFLIKGGKAEIPAGTQIQGTVTSNIEINL